MSPVHWLDRPLSDDWEPSEPACYSMFRSWHEAAIFIVFGAMVAILIGVGAFRLMAWLMVETWK